MLTKFGDLTKIERDGTVDLHLSQPVRPRGLSTCRPACRNKPGRPLSPIALDEILRSNVWNDYIFRDAEYFWQTSLLEPVGGMDNFFKGFLRQPSRKRGTIGRAGAPRLQGDSDRRRERQGHASPTSRAASRARSPPITASRPSRCRCSRR